MHERRVIIGVMGGADPNMPEPVLRQAETAGRLVAESGAVLLCGGRTGVMEAAAKGAKSVVGGETLAILPGSDPDGANRYIDLAVATGMGNGRNIINVLSSDAVIALPGGEGTLSEIALALKCGIPTISLSGWDLEAARIHDPKNLQDRLFHKATSPEEAVTLALGLAKKAVSKPEKERKILLETLQLQDRYWNNGDIPGLLNRYWPGSTTTVFLDGRRVIGIEPLASFLDRLFRGEEENPWKRSVHPESLNVQRLPGNGYAAAYTLEVVRRNEEPRLWQGSAVFVRRENDNLIVGTSIFR
ncbi:MAG: TIGR00725 family protein [Planctomycetes bacterium]|nr:TIGR00725 family protein [Planctomycetota bacterium]